MVTIEVTQADIDGAIQTIENEQNWKIYKVCPIARAMNRILPSSKAQWGVGEDAFLYHDFSKIVEAAMPSVAGAWRDQFDADFNSVKPFSFEIAIDLAKVPV